MKGEHAGEGSPDAALTGADGTGCIEFESADERRRARDAAEIAGATRDGVDDLRTGGLA